ncbi:MAG TPA: DUF4446 family protein [Patescibacteria group bacterium]|jgi:hypothetical protein|nr:DUF4446 family protein [Patescibacteria group bacterium]
MSATVLTYISLGAAGISLVFGVYAVIAAGQARKWRKFFSGNEAAENLPENLEDIIEKIAQRLKQLDESSDKTASTLEAITNQLNTATQHVGIIRYNGNGDDGGNLSFSAALLDAHQSGIVITSLHGRQNSRIYAKVIVSGASEQTLSEEEREALIQALTKK